MASTSPGTNLTDNGDSSEISRGPRIIFLLLFIIISFVGNLFILVVILQHKKFRTVQNLLIWNLCFVGVMDCVTNMSLVLGALARDHWVYGDFMCRCNTFFMNFVAILTMLLMASLTLDRFFAITFPGKFENWLISSYRFYLFVLYFWIHSLAFSIPFLTGVATPTFRTELHLCTVNGDSSLSFLYASLLICFLLPLIIVIVFQFLLLRLSCRQTHVNKKKSLTEKQYRQMLSLTLTDSPQPKIQSPLSHISNSNTDVKATFSSSIFSDTLFVHLLFVSWLILYAPYAVASNIKQYHHSQDESNASNSETLPDYPWELEATFIWMRFFFSSLVPCLVFYCRKDIWHSTKECILCRKHNSVVDMEGECQDSTEAIVNKMENNVKSDSNNFPPTPKQKEKEKGDFPVAFTVPVLFATSNGIHIEGDSSDAELDSKSFSVLNSSDLPNSTHLLGKSLDVNSGDNRQCQELILGDTSDYDSSCEIDPYSLSQPVSTRNVIGTLRRSLSKEISIFSQTQRDFSGTIGADSGLDLSGTAGSSAGHLIKTKLLEQESRIRLNNDKDKSEVQGNFSPKQPKSNLPGNTFMQTQFREVQNMCHEESSNTNSISTH